MTVYQGLLEMLELAIKLNRPAKEIDEIKEKIAKYED